MADPRGTSLGRCLDALTDGWRRDGGLAGLWQAWPRIAGSPLADHCRPLRLQGGVLWVGADHPSWLQALRFSRHQLLGALRAAGHPVRDLKIEQRDGALASPTAVDLTASDWDQHPSRPQQKAMVCCPACRCPAPEGELLRWGRCAFCQRQAGDLSGRPSAT